MANPGCSVKPCQVFIGADTGYELTFGLDHSVGADQPGEAARTLDNHGTAVEVDVVENGSGYEATRVALLQS